jgi:hypothetical protein
MKSTTITIFVVLALSLSACNGIKSSPATELIAEPVVEPVVEAVVEPIAEPVVELTEIPFESLLL